jgi:hypothetical protein
MAIVAQALRIRHKADNEIIRHVFLINLFSIFGTPFGLFFPACRHYPNHTILFIFRHYPMDVKIHILDD